MQAASTASSEDSHEIAPRFNVVVAYEDTAASRRALQTCDLVAKTLGADVQLNKSLWKFDLLQNPGLKELASSDAEMADMIILSAHEEQIPPFVHSWLEGSSRSTGSHPRALVALLDHASASESNANLRPLRDLASSCQMDFFFRTD